MMMSGYKNRSEHLIYQRRAQQQKLDTLNGKLKQEFYHKEFARWENKGGDVEKTNQMKRRLQELRDYARRQLNHRRQRLSVLLEGESQKYQKEIIDSQETPEQVRARMAERVRQLKQERENEKKRYVDEQLERRFEMNADELRKVDGELKMLRTDLDRNVQLIEKQAIMENKYEQQILFAELNRRQLRKRDEIENQKVRQAREKVEQRNAILGLQREMKQQKTRKDKQLHELEKQMLKDEWEKQRQAIRERDAEAQLRQKDATRQLLDANQLQKKMKQFNARRQKEMDRELLDQVLARERDQAEAEKEQRFRDREEAKRVLAGMKNKGLQGAAQEKELQRLIEQQRLRREAKQYEQWRKGEEARINLLKDVYGDRERKVKQNLNQRDEQKRLKELDKLKIAQSLKQYNQEEEQKKRQQLIVNKQDQQRLLEEIRLKQQKRRVLLLELEKQESDISRARKDYDKKIQDRKQKGRQELDQFKKTNRLF